MARKITLAFLSVMALGVTCAGVRAAPSRDLNTVRDWQIPATKKQWFVPVEWTQTPQMRRIIPSPVSSAKEFHDNVAPRPYPPEGTPWGGSASWSAIKGVITNLWYIDGTPGPLLSGFTIRAEVTNDLYTYTGVLSGTSAMNAHWQSAPDIVGQQWEFMYEVRLTAEFADDGPATLLNLPTVWPFGPESSIITGFYDYLSWYSFTSVEPPPFPFVAPGGYWVPTFSMTGPLAQDPMVGTPDVIEPGDTHYRDLPFGLRTALPPGDSLRVWLENAYANGYDLFQNRAKSWNLKIPYYPGPSAYRDIGLPDDTGTVSVFYNTDAPAKDWGDAPDPTYPTLAASGGASHVIVPHMFLGRCIDGEPDGQPDPNALGDDNNPVGLPDDEDGVRFTSALIPGGVATVQVTASVQGKLDAWADFNSDGDWGDAGEQIFTSQQLLGGVNTLSFGVPTTYKSGTPVCARFRFSSTGGLSFAGPAYDGEVEDYIIRGQEEPIENDLGDAPDSSNSYPLSPMTAYPGVTASYPSVYRAGSPPYGPIHWQPTALAYLGASVTLENEADIGADQDPTNNIIPWANTADLDRGDDGVQLPLSLPSLTMTTFNYGVTVVSQQPNVTLFVNVWCDWNRDGDWDDIIQLPGGQIVQEWAVQNQNLGSPAPGVYTFTTPQFLPWNPAGAAMMPMWMRVTLSEQRWNPSGLPGDGGSGPMVGYAFGETEDYYFTPDAAPQDFGDTPDPTYPTLRASNGARHAVVPGMFLGTTIDSELDGQPEAQALGDDLNGVANEEDGMRNLSMLTPGQPASFNVVASVAGMLDAWIDFDRDGSWAQPGDQIAASLPLAAGVNPVNFVVPPTGKPGVTFARLRFSRQGGLSFTGAAPDGEVEDYQLRITDPIKWIQEPDLTSLGIDVNAAGTDRYILADDFLCTTTGPITDIHIWGSWFADAFPWGDPRGMGFTLSIHEDIPDPDGSGPEFSKPGRLLWRGDFPRTSYDCVQVATVPRGEGWLNPGLSYVFPGDYMVFRYDFHLDKPWLQPFIQRGSPKRPVVYWLDVQHVAAPDGGPTEVFGWKTSTRHWNDDAVWGMGVEPFEGPWNELRYPPGHQQQGQSIDLAFAITGSEGSEDWGDAPDPSYPTLAASNGASHVILPGFCLGQAIDSEPDGQPDPDALGDDNNGVPDDEDGVVFTTLLIPGARAKVAVTASAVGFLDAWLDFGGDGGWSEASDRIFASQPLVSGVNILTFRVPVEAKPGPTFARFRLSSAGGLAFTGPALDGEVEDYQVKIGPTPIVVTKGWAKALPLGTFIRIEKNVVTANFGSSGWYLEEPDRFAGLGVIPPPDTISPWQPDELVSCIGQLYLNGCELMIQEIDSWYEGRGKAPALGQNNRGSGGGPFYNQPGLWDNVSPPEPASGLNSVGLKVKLWGRCTYVETDIGDPTVQLNFWIDDGSALWDGTFKPTGAPALGVKARVPAGLLEPIKEGKYYAVTGIMRTDYDPSGQFCVRWLWPRDGRDVMLLPE